MHYIIQENVFKETHYEILEQTLEKLGLPYTTVRIFPFVDKIVNLKDIVMDENYDIDSLPEFIPDTDNVFVFGAIKLARVASNKKWFPGSFMNGNHDFMVYRDFYKENLLNWDSEIRTVGDKVTWYGEKFIRPTKDTKSFTGKTYTSIEWNDLVRNNLHNQNSEIFNESTQIQISTVKNIQKEIRFWVVDGKVVTGSVYRLGNRTVYDEYFDPDAFSFAQRMVDIFQIARAFVIDVCLVDDEWKIVECNCINCAGFYKGDLQKTIIALENCYG